MQLIFKARGVRRPGSRGSTRWWFDEAGQVRYDDKPVPNTEQLSLFAFEGDNTARALKFEPPVPPPEPEPPVTPPTPPAIDGVIMTARFPSRCRICGGKINKGDKILWKPGMAVHPGCAGHDAGPVTPPIVKPPKEDPEVVNAKKKAARFRELADKMDAQIEAKLNPSILGQNYTDRRARIGASIVHEGEVLREVQAKLRALADAHEAGQVPPLLAGLNSKVMVQDMMFRKNPPTPYVHKVFLEDLLQIMKGKRGFARACHDAENLINRMVIRRDCWMQLSHADFETIWPLYQAAKKIKGKNFNVYNEGLTDYNRYVEAGIRPQQYLEARQALLDLGGAVTPLKSDKEREMEKRKRELLSYKIPGFFPTPRPIVEQLLAEADIRPGMKVLEPSAGMGHIADAIRETAPDADLSVVEYNASLNEFLRDRGHNVVDHDFLQHQGQYDRVVMNPPFENGQDMMHVRHAYDLLKPGGRVVAIMSEGPFFRQFKSDMEFRSWLESVDGRSERLPAGAFMASEHSTGVQTRIVVIDKPEE